MFDMRSLLSERELNIVKQCLRAAVEGQFFPDWEFETLFGIDRSIVKQAFEQWPFGLMSVEDVGSAAIGSLNNLLGYPHRNENEWNDFISVPPEEVRLVLERLLEVGL
jgi:hypothetical protein